MTETQEEKLLKNTIEEEKAQVSNMVRKLGSKLSGLMLTCGFLIFMFGIYVLIVPPELAFSAIINIIFIGALGFIGGLNILCGFLLLLGED